MSKKKKPASVHMQAATGAGSVVRLSNGREVELRPLTIKDISEIGKACLELWRREQLELLQQNRDLLGEDYPRLVTETLERLQQTTVDDLPRKQVAVDPDDLSKTTSVPYYIWWMQQPGEGMFHAIWLSARRANPELTLEDTREMFDEIGAIRDAAETVGSLSTPKLAPEGNGESPPAGASASPEKAGR